MNGVSGLAGDVGDDLIQDLAWVTAPALMLAFSVGRKAQRLPERNLYGRLQRCRG
jgi:hypothetical protein